MHDTSFSWTGTSTLIKCGEETKRLKIPTGLSESVNRWMTTQCPKVKRQRDKQRSTKHTHKTKYRLTRAPLKPGSELRCSERVSSSCSTSDIRRVNQVINSLINHEWGKDRKVFYFELKYNFQYHISSFVRNWQNAFQQSANRKTPWKDVLIFQKCFTLS